MDRTKEAKTINISTKTIKVIVSSLVIILTFSLGILGCKLVSLHSQKISEANEQSLLKQQIASEEEKEHKDYVKTLLEVNSNIERDIDADLYSIKIHGLSAIAAKYQEAKMRNTLLDPSVRTEIFEIFIAAVDEQFKEFVGVYKTAVESAEYQNERSNNQLTYKVQTEKKYQQYNQTYLANEVNALKRDLGNCILIGNFENIGL